MARQKIKQQAATQLLFESDQICNLCHDASAGVQLHHIDGDHSNSIAQNLIVLCLDCHDKATKGPGLSRGVSPDLLFHYKQFWTNKVSEYRKSLDLGKNSRKTRVKLKAKEAKVVEIPFEESIFDHESAKRTFESRLPHIQASRVRAAVHLKEMTTVSMNWAMHLLIEDTIQELLFVADFFPQGHFGASAKKYFRRWQRDIANLYFRSSQNGDYGTMIGQIVGRRVLSFFEDLLEQSIDTLVGDPEWMDDWRTNFRRAIQLPISVKASVGSNIGHFGLLNRFWRALNS